MSERVCVNGRGHCIAYVFVHGVSVGGWGCWVGGCENSL